MPTYVSYELLNTNRNGMRLLIEVLTSQYHVRALRTQKELETFEFLYLGAPTISCGSFDDTKYLQMT